MSLLNLERHRDPAGDVREFQSLFSWMSLLNGSLLVELRLDRVVSILVLVDVALEPHHPHNSGPEIVFHSLFSWVSPFNR